MDEYETQELIEQFFQLAEYHSSSARPYGNSDGPTIVTVALLLASNVELPREHPLWLSHEKVAELVECNRASVTRRVQKLRDLWNRLNRDTLTPEEKACLRAHRLSAKSQLSCATR